MQFWLFWKTRPSLWTHFFGTSDFQCRCVTKLVRMARGTPKSPVRDKASGAPLKRAFGMSRRLNEFLASQGHPKLKYGQWRNAQGYQNQFPKWLWIRSGYMVTYGHVQTHIGTVMGQLVVKLQIKLTKPLIRRPFKIPKDHWWV